MATSAFPWDTQQLDLIDAHYRYHSEMCVVIQEYRNAGPEGRKWPRKPKGCLPPSRRDKRTLAPSELHEYLIKHLAVQQPLSCPKLENVFDLVQLLNQLKIGYEVLKTQSAAVLATSIDYGNLLETAFNLHFLDKAKGLISVTWEEWLKINIGIGKSYAFKLREIGNLLKDYPRFRRLGLSFSEVYTRRNDIKAMLLLNPEAAYFWKANI